MTARDGHRRTDETARVVVALVDARLELHDLVAKLHRLARLRVMPGVIAGHLERLGVLDEDLRAAANDLIGQRAGEAHAEGESCET